jgi:hypothetical protein
MHKPARITRLNHSDPSALKRGWGRGRGLELLGVLDHILRGRRGYGAELHNAHNRIAEAVPSIVGSLEE